MHTFGLALMLRDLCTSGRGLEHIVLAVPVVLPDHRQACTGLGLAASVGVKRKPGKAVGLQCQKLSRLKASVLLWVSFRSGYFYLICAMASCFVVCPTSFYPLAIHVQQYPPSISGRRRSCFSSSERQKDEEGELPLKRDSVILTLDFLCEDFHFF